MVMEPKHYPSLKMPAVVVLLELHDELGHQAGLAEGLCGAALEQGPLASGEAVAAYLWAWV